MIPKLHCFHLARFVLEAETAFAVNSGLRDGAFDSVIVKDANGLPTIPGTSLAGVLRHHYAALIGQREADSLFGFMDKDEGEASRLHISWGYIHNSHNQAVEGICYKLEQDPLLERLQQAHSFHRERVSMTERGAAKDGSKFDVTVVPAGCRFSFEISYWADQKQDKHWQQLLNLLHRPIQLGSNTRNGLGWFQLESLHQISLDLKDKADWQCYKDLPFSVTETETLSVFEHINDLATPIKATIELEAEDFWRFGQTGDALKATDKAPDATPLLEPVIDWQQKPARFSVKKVVIPASGVKGALSHRVQFHYHCLTDSFIGSKSEVQQNLLFGEKGDKDDQGQAGLLLFKDLYIDKTPIAAHVNHTSIDRFTGGVRDKVLFTEEVIWKNGFTLDIQIDPIQLKQLKTHDNQQALKNYKAALQYALDDLAEGRLALGAGSAKGHGYFKGRVNWSDNGEWIGIKND